MRSSVISCRPSSRPGTSRSRVSRQPATSGMSLQDDANLVKVIDHAGPHPELYHEVVYRRLIDATKGLAGSAYKDALISQLTRMANELRTPGSLLNKLATKR
jgi:filamentous hemagglutinin